MSDQESWEDEQNDEVDQQFNMNLVGQLSSSIVQQQVTQAINVSEQQQVVEEEAKLDPSWKMKDQIKHCQHYFRYCEKLAPCCQIYYPCRLCHDENYKGVKAPGCKVEVMERQKVERIKCKRCELEQLPSEKCEKCSIVFGLYYCPICKFWDDDVRKKGDIYHCEKCNMCRRGNLTRNVHCDNCGVCIAKSANHKCQKQAFHQNCPVCMEFLQNSVKYITQFKNCGHWIHLECQAGLQTNRCPLCNTAIEKMHPMLIKQYDEICEKTKDHIPPEMKDKTVQIFCHECLQTSKDVQWHFYLKCQQCGSYNTKQ